MDKTQPLPCQPPDQLEKPHPSVAQPSPPQPDPDPPQPALLRKPPPIVARKVDDPPVKKATRSKHSAKTKPAGKTPPPPTGLPSAVALPSSTKLKTNQLGGVYERGKAIGFADKVRIANIYLRLCEERAALDPTNPKHGKAVSSRELMRAAGVSKTYASKIMKEIQTTKTVSDPAAKQQFRVRGRGNKTFTLQDEELLLEMASGQPRPSLSSMKRRLEEVTGTQCSKTTIHSFLKEKQNQPPSSTK